MNAKTLLILTLLLAAQPSLGVPLSEDGMATTPDTRETVAATKEKVEKKNALFDNDAAVGCASGAAVGSLTLAPGLGTVVGCGIGALIAWLW